LFSIKDNLANLKAKTMIKPDLQLHRLQVLFIIL